MSSAPPSVPDFRLLSASSSAKFLGLTVAERNARVARRALGHADPPDAADLDGQRTAMPTLIVPAGIAITPTLIHLLPRASGSWTLVWNGTGRPLMWHNEPARNGRPAGDDPHESSIAGVDGRPATFVLPAGAALDVSTPSARWRSAWQLLKTSGKPTDGWLARHVHRRISRIFSYVLLQFGLTANIATALTFLVGVASAWLCAQTSHRTMIAGAFLFWFASIADGIDGEMARLTLSESERGEQIDTAVDHATHFLCYAGLMVGWWRQGIGRFGAALAVTVAVGIPLALLWGMKIVRGAGLHRGDSRRETQFFVDTKPVELAVIRAARDTGAPALRLASSIFVLFRREVFSLTFFLISLTTGERAVYPALLALGLVVVTTTLVAYRRPIERALHA